jgi:hypothetical protein
VNVPEKIQKIKPALLRGREYENDIIVVLVVLFVGLISFGLGRLSALSEQKTPIVVENLAGALGEVGTPQNKGGRANSHTRWGKSDFKH